MDKKAIENINIDIDEIVTRLNRALADEWLAYYQYWIASKVVVGLLRKRGSAQLMDHANMEAL